MVRGGNLQYSPTVRSLAELPKVVTPPVKTNPYKVEVALTEKEERAIRRYMEAETTFSSEEEQDKYWEVVDEIRDKFMESIFPQLPEPESPKLTPVNVTTVFRVDDPNAPVFTLPDIRTIDIEDRDGRLSGISVNYVVKGDSAYISRVDIPCEYSGKGYAKLLTKLVFRAAHDLGLKTVSTDPSWKELTKQVTSVWRWLKTDGYNITLLPQMCIADVTSLPPEALAVDAPEVVATDDHVV